MTHFFDKRDLWGNRYSLWIVVLMAFVTPLCWWSLRQLRLENDVEKWLPDSDSELRSLRWAHEQFPVEERILLTWEGSSINDPRVGKLVEQLAGKPDAHGVKRGGLPYVASVIEPLHALNLMQRNGIDAHEAVRRLEGTIIGAGMLRLRLTETGRSSMRKTKRELQSAMRAKYGLELGILDASPDLTPLVSVPAPVDEGEATGEPSPPTILSADGKFAENPSVEHDLQVSWKGMRIGSESTIAITRWLTEYVPERGDGKPLVESGFYAPGSPVALAIGISEAGLADKTETVAAIRTACKLAGIPGEALHMAGSAVSATELNEEVFKAVWDTSFPLVQIHRRSVILTSALVSALLAYALVRSIRLASFVLFISLFTMVCSMALVPITGGSMNMVLIVMPTLLIVLTMSGAIHVANYWKHAACKDEAHAISKTVRMSWRPCFLASLTTAIGLISLCTSSLTPVRHFGIYAAVGTMFSLLMVVYGLPSLMQLWTGRPPKEHELDHAGWRTFGRMLTVHSGWQSLAVIAICIGCSIGLNKFRTETKVIRYFPDHAKIAQDYWYIETNLAGVMPVEMVVRFDQQSQKDTNFLERMELVRLIQEKMRIHPEISGSVSLADFQPEGERPSEDAGFLQKTKYNKRAMMIHQRIRDGEIPAARSFYTMSERGHDFQEPGDGKLNQPGDELWRVTAQVNVMTDNDFAVVMADLHRIAQDVLKLQPGSQHLITGVVPLFVRTQQAVLQSLISSFGLAFVLIFGVFVIMLRSVAAGVIAMIPNIVPITVVFGVLSWIGGRIDIGSMITASIALGIAVDGTLHYLTWVRMAMKNGRTRQDAIFEALVHCGPAMWQTSAAVALGLLVLVPAELLLISRFGSLMAAMIGVALLGDIVLMPQLLGGPLGWLFEPAKKSGAKALEIEKHEVTVIAPPIAAILEETAVPSPHMKPSDPAPKKRRSTSRRERDAG
jgi:predicted RND superfamily exporter protein